MALEQRFNLQLVVGVEYSIDRAAVVLEELADDVSDDADLRVIEHRSYQNGLVHTRASLSQRMTCRLSSNRMAG